jgi:hypothetical protein
LSAIADDAIDGFELADYLDLDDPGQAIFAVFDLRRESGIRVRGRTEPDGQMVFHRGDVEAAVVERERRREAPERDPLPPRVEVELSDPGSTYSEVPSKPSSNADDGIEVAAAAEARGITEERLSRALVGKAKLGVSEGKLIVRRADLDRLEREQAIPSASTEARTRKVEASIGEEPEQDPDLDRRVAEAADRIGLDRAEVGLDAAPADPAVEARTAEAAGALGMDPAEVGAKPKRSAADRRAEQVAKSMGIDYPG